ncbi:MAG: 50S ribosomal protein L11 methyltransferase [Ktedonobacteraceae bacterium]|nr:50S ribosomal protein L11 methyltransferase [Ktedonobacteraceae bacterium]
MLWLELTVKAHPEAVESVSELLSRYIPSGVAIEEPIELLGEGQEYRVLTGQPVSVHAYVPIDGKQEEVRQHIEEGLWHLACLGEHFVSAMQTRVVDEQDWASAWKDYFHVTHIGQHLVIRPSWREYTPKSHEVVLTLDPGMAFGTGLHPTTRMCLEQIEQHVRPAMHVLDVGTGSGILALAAAKLAATYVYALDNDSVAVESATSNVAMNGLEERVKVVLGVLNEQEAARMAGKYDLVVVNIIAHVIGLLAPQLARVLAPDGLLIVSGIVEARLHDALDPLLAQKLEVIDRVMIDDWIALMLRKRED